MSHEIDMSRGRANMAYTGDTPWHGLGEQLPPNADLETWKKAAGMDWEVLAGQTMFKTPTGRQIHVPRSNVLYRSDTLDPLGVVSDRYKAVQPGEVLEFYRDLMERFNFELETAGCLKGGKRVWALANTGQEAAFGEAMKDVVKRYVLLATSYDGTMATQAMQTSVRVVCQNTLNFAVNSKEPRVKISHISDFDPNHVKSELGLDTGWEQFTERVAEMAKYKMTEEDSAMFFINTFFPNKAEELDYDDLPVSVVNRLADLLDIREKAPGQQMDSANDTLWGTVNAITYWADHARKTQSEDNRLDSAWFGDGRAVKDRAYENAVSLLETA